MSNEFNFGPEKSAPGAVVGDSGEDQGKGKGKKKKKKKGKAAKKKRGSSSSSASSSSEPKPKQFNAYTSLLLVTLLCLTIGSLLLYFELVTYGEFPWWKPPEG